VSSGNRRNCRTRNYKKLLEKLPAKIAEIADAQFQLFLENPFAEPLHNHPIADNDKGQHRDGSRAVSVTFRYRALYVEDGDTNVWYWIGTHEDYNDFIGKT
jgi:hypothetical protein